MKQLYILTLSILTAFTASAQCGGRYHNYIFADSVVTDINYGSATNLSNNTEQLDLDIHFPKGDVVTSRPLVIMAHGGNFLGGDKAGSDVMNLCTNLAQMGYVVASINYRVGMKNFPFPGPDSTDAAETVIRASHDAKAAVRFFRASFENGNPYGIDTSLIFFSGVSAGGFMALNVGYFDKLSEFPTFVDTTGEPGLSGGVEGVSGSPGYSSNVAGIINICGAIRDTAWIDAGDIPMLNLHGDQDGTVPYGSALIYLLGTYPLLDVDGSQSIAARADEMNIINCFETHEGQNHVPHTDNGPYYDTTINLMRNFMAHFVCGDPLNCNYGPVITSTPNVYSAGFDIYPNPSENEFNVELPSNELSQVVITDIQGKIVFSETRTGNNYQITRPEIAAGTYIIKISQADKLYSGKIIFK